MRAVSGADGETGPALQAGREDNNASGGLWEGSENERGRELVAGDFLLSKTYNQNHFIIKNIDTIPYLFLYSNEQPNMSKNINYRSEYSTHYKFSIGNNSKIFQYENGRIIEITDSYFNSLYKTGLFTLLLQETAFHNKNEKYITSKTIINIIKDYYREYRGIIECLEKLHSMYERHKRNIIP